MRKTVLIWVMLMMGVVAYAQVTFRGVDFTNHHFSALDSAVLRRNSVMYSGRDAYGQVRDSKETAYIKWYNNKEKYYPVMHEAWKYCLNKLPYQLNMYKDGDYLYQQMMNEYMDDSVRCKKYTDELLKLYDLRIQNIDSINAHVKRVSDKSSKGNMMLFKTRVYDYYIMGNRNGVSEKSIPIMYPMYKEAMEEIRKAYNEGLDNGGDVDMDGLYSFFDYTANKYFYTYISVDSAPDSVRKKVLDDAKKVLLEDYNFLKDFCYQQMERLGADYVDTLSVGGEDSLEVVQQKVIMPYKEFLTHCEKNLVESLKIRVAVQTLAMAEGLYGLDLDKYKEELNRIEKLNDKSKEIKKLKEIKNWFTRVKKDCEETIDCTPDNILYYPFYEETDNLLGKVEEIMKGIKIPGPRPDDPLLWYNKAKPFWNRCLQANQRTKGQVDDASFDAALYCIYCYKNGLRRDPGNQKLYKDRIAWLRKACRAEAFMRTNVKQGQMRTVNGETFPIDF